MPFLPLLMRFLIPALSWLFRTKLGYFIVTMLAWLGINWGTMKLVIGPTMDLVRAFADGAGGFGDGSDLAATAQAWAGVLNFDRALTMILSAYVAREGVLNARMYFFKRTAPGA